MVYVDGYLLLVPKKKIRAYAALARKAGRIWKDHGALEYRECVGDDLAVPCGESFPKRLRAKPSEAVVFSWVVYKSRAHRDRANEAIMKDPRMVALCTAGMPFDMNKMSHGGFELLVDM
ncbi:MAG TPA: DUF1428 domain-containing protein [Planctomycetota bacterium]